ncbi:hypothetical protein [Streptomyces sp. 7-21]|uniref:hypothetical protein n=1 Tax=Streptomyces sp. 7-21 TaxID=2802283 RepID=UPI00191CD99A|nr:hypothetical protein [Streptomyces sp. 7-21]MBL1069009.1 hypothetical protein [Streptomyces sp. 7-21]
MCEAVVHGCGAKGSEAASAELIEIPVTKNDDGTLSLTMTEEQYASVAFQLAVGAAVMGG